MNDFYQGTQLLGGKIAPLPKLSTAPAPAPATAPAPAPAPAPAQPQGFSSQMSSLTSQISNSSDDAGVMQSAFQGLDLMRPDLAKSVRSLAPDQQNRVLASYVNAVRTGNPYNAHEVAAQEFQKLRAEQSATQAATAPAAPVKQPSLLSGGAQAIGQRFLGALKKAITEKKLGGAVQVRQGSSR